MQLVVFILFALVLGASANDKLGCFDENGSPVDW